MLKQGANLTHIRCRLTCLMPAVQNIISPFPLNLFPVFFFLGILDVGLDVSGTCLGILDVGLDVSGTGLGILDVGLDTGGTGLGILDAGLDVSDTGLGILDVGLGCC